MPTSGTNATRESVITEFIVNFVNVANASVQFTLSVNPFTNAGLGLYATFLSDQYVALASVNEIPDINTVASTVNNLLRAYAFNATRIRNAQYYYNNNGVQENYGFGTTLFNDGFLHDPGVFSANANQPDANTNLSGAELSAFILYLQSTLAVARSNVIEMYACHSSCHTNCHSARGRR